jgi:hypothetical protein
MDEGVRILELARNVQKPLAQQEPRQKRRLIDFVLSNCSCKMVGFAPLFANPLIYWHRCLMHHQLRAPVVDEHPADRSTSPIARSAAPSGNAQASDVIAPPSNPATTARRSIAANSNSSALHSVGIGRSLNQCEVLLRHNLFG